LEEKVKDLNKRLNKFENINNPINGKLQIINQKNNLAK